MDLEKYVEMDIDSPNGTIPTTTAIRTASDVSEPLFSINSNTANTRRHTVGPGDVAHEQALANPALPMNFKFGPENGPHLPINLPMLQNQPLNNFTMKNQHLLKPPTFMEASKITSNTIVCN